MIELHESFFFCANAIESANEEREKRKTFVHCDDFTLCSFAIRTHAMPQKVNSILVPISMINTNISRNLFAFRSFIFLFYRLNCQILSLNTSLCNCLHVRVHIRHVRAFNLDHFLFSLFSVSFFVSLMSSIQFLQDSLLVDVQHFFDFTRFRFFYLLDENEQNRSRIRKSEK